METFDIDKLRIAALNYAEKNKIVNQKTITSLIKKCDFVHIQLVPNFACLDEFSSTEQILSPLYFPFIK